MLGALAALFVAGGLVPLTYRRWPRLTAWAATALAALLFVGFAAQVPAIARGERLVASVPWVPSLGVSLALLLDGLSAAFALLITGIGALVLAYAIGYLGHGPRLARLLSLLLLFAGSMLGLVLADDAISLFVFWELTSLTSFFLIAFDDTVRRARENARQALIVTAAGGLALLVGLLLLARASVEAGADGGLSATLSALADLDLRDAPLYPAIVILVAAGAFTKSAQVPFHFWLPGAMVAPTPVSAYLHSATMVQAGVYVLARLQPSLGGTALWTGLLTTVGCVTLVTGGLLAVLQRDLKLVLAYSTTAILGALVLLIGLGTQEAIEAFAALLVAHAAYKAALFLVAGNIDHQTGTRDPVALRGLAGAMPVTAAAALLAAAAMAGVPPLLGFIGKESLYLAATSGPAALLIGTAVAGAGALLVAAAWIAGVGPFLGRGRPPVRWHDAPAPMLIGPALLAVGGLLFGVLGALLNPLVAPIGRAIAPEAEDFRLALWHGLGAPYGAILTLGLSSLILGTLLFGALARRPHGGAILLGALEAIAAARAYRAALTGLQAGAERMMAILQSGHLRRYTIVTLGFVLLVLAGALAGGGGRGMRAGDALAYEIVLVALAGAGGIAAVVMRDRLATVAALGATGLSIAVLFALKSAPDLAITQLMVETLSLILLVLVFRRLPPRLTHRDRPAHLAGDAVVAVILGGLVTTILLLVTAAAEHPPDAAQGQVVLAAGQHAGNVVNAILVNFRALDTLGELTVLVIAGIGVYALLRLRPSGQAR
jgi:multicomponent Na+:H+ antiporter subunit A